MSFELEEYVPGKIWLCSYPVRYFGTELDARMTVIRLDDGRLMLHSPCEIDSRLKQELEEIGTVAFVIAPGNFHYLHVPSAQAAFPDAKTFICPGVERKLPELKYDFVLDDDVPAAWADEVAQVLIKGSRWMREVAFFHRESGTLILVDVIENITDRTPRANWQLKFWWKLVFRMWNKARPAPEYQLGWRDKNAARNSLREILQWDFTRVIIAHGDLIEHDAKKVVEDAWRNVLTMKQGR
jgi:hypothetical protein